MGKQRADDWIQRFLWQGADFIERRLRPLRVALYSVLLFRRNLGFERAATLSFTSVIAMIPMVVLFFSFARRIGEGDKIISYVETEILPMVVPRSALDQGHVRSWLLDNISPTVFESQEAGLVNISAIIALVVTAVLSLDTAERIFNRMWNVEEERGYLRKARDFWLLLTTFPFLITISMYVGNFLVPEGGWIDSLTRDYWGIRIVYEFVVPTTAAFAAFCIVYWRLPFTRVKLRSAALGAIVAAVLWEFSKRGFFLYVERAKNVTNFYGGIATVPLFLVWIYVSWIITLSGNQLVYAHQNFFAIRRARQLRRRHQKRSSSIHLGIATLEILDAAFQQSKLIQIDDVAARLGVPAERLEAIAHHLVRDGFLVEDASDDRRYVLSRPGEALRLADAARSLLELDLPFDELPHPRYRGEDIAEATMRVRGAWQGFLTALGDVTVKDLRPEEEPTTVPNDPADEPGRVEPDPLSGAGETP